MVLDDFHKFCRIDLQLKSGTAYLHGKFVQGSRAVPNRMIGKLDGENGGGYKESDYIDIISIYRVHN